MAVFYNISQYLIRRPKIADQNKSIYMSHASLGQREDFRKKSIRDAIDVVEEDSEIDPNLSIPTSDTDSNA
jgi:hypothetical protein